MYFKEHCSNCDDCLAVIRTSDRKKIYYWVANDPIDIERSSPGECVERYDSTTGEERPVDSKDLCGKRVFLECSNSLTKSVVKSCPLQATSNKQQSAGSAMKISTVTASLIAAFTAYLIFN
jgi:hypothetical protein